MARYANDSDKSSIIILWEQRTANQYFWEDHTVNIHDGNNITHPV